MFSGLRKTLGDQLERRRHRPFLEAAMASCALIAIADGVVTLSERSRVDQILERLDELRFFDVHEAVNLFNDFVAGIEQDHDKGRQDALAAVAKMKGERAEARLLIRICIAVSWADDEFPESERHEVEAVCRLLGFEPAEFLEVDGLSGHADS